MQSKEVSGHKRIVSFRFNYHLEKVRDLVNTAFTNLFPVDELIFANAMDIDESVTDEKSSTNFVDPVDRIMCQIVDEIPF